MIERKTMCHNLVTPSSPFITISSIILIIFTSHVNSQFRAENLISKTVITSEEYPGSGIELPQNNRAHVLWCNSTIGAKVDHWEFNGVEQRSDPERSIEIDPQNGSLSIKRVDRSKHEGNYTCCMTNNDCASIEVKAKPEVIIESEGMAPGGMSLNVVEGDSISLVCRMRGNESVQGMYWEIQKDDEETGTRLADTTRDNISINETKTDGGQFISSRLSISSASFSDRAVYRCVVDSRVSLTRVQILIRVKDKLAALWPFLGIVGEVIILCTIIFIYEKRRVKPDFDEDVKPEATQSQTSKRNN